MEEWTPNMSEGVGIPPGGIWGRRWRRLSSSSISVTCFRAKSVEAMSVSR